MSLSKVILGLHLAKVDVASSSLVSRFEKSLRRKTGAFFVLRVTPTSACLAALLFVGVNGLGFTTGVIHLRRSQD